MTKELEQLGGGEARIGQTYVHCYVSQSPPARKGSSDLETQHAGLSVRDPRNSQSASHAKVFNVPHNLNAAACIQEIHNNIGKVSKANLGK